MKKIILALVAFAVVSMLAIPAMAATEWNFGASLRYATFWTQVDNGKAPASLDLEGGGRSVTNDGKLDWNLQGNTRIKMFMKSDSLEGFIEMGYDFDRGIVKNREFWGRYRINDMLSIQIGEIHQLFNTPGLSNQVWAGDMGMHSMGIAWDPPTPKIVLSYGGFSFALAKYYQGAIMSGYTADRDTYIPQLQASYQYKADTWRMKLAGGFQTFSYNKLSANAAPTITKDRTINSWIVSLDGNIDFGPLYLAGNVSAGQNWTDAQWNTTRGGLADNLARGKTLGLMRAQFEGADMSVKNTNSIMAAIVAAYRLTEDLRFEAGVGYRYDDNSMWKDSSSMWNLYLQAAYRIAPGFQIIPEIGYIDLGDTIVNKNATKGVNNGYIWYAGAKWQMDF